MRVSLPLLRIQPTRAPILRYGVAVLSTTLALIPALLLPNIAESRLADFAGAVMVSAWDGGVEPTGGGHLLRADGERVFCIFNPAKCGAIPLNHDPPGFIFCPGDSDLLAQ